jgi:hypothetical protein
MRQSAASLVARLARHCAAATEIRGLAWRHIAFVSREKSAARRAPPDHTRRFLGGIAFA